MTGPQNCVTVVHMSVAPRNLNAPQKVTAALLADELIASAAAVQQADEQAAQARRDRDTLIRDAATIVPMLRLARLTGLSRERIYRIVYSGDPSTPPTKY